MMIKFPEKLLWSLQRLSAVLLFLFFIWVLVSLYFFEISNYTETVAWIKIDFNAFLLFLFSLIIFTHVRLGLSVIIDDYIHSKSNKYKINIFKDILIFSSIIFSGICLYLI
tara:strand:- start:1674 stop:2006 length:333 start_codon:yes stop_codon:yes gene_type:complete